VGFGIAAGGVGPQLLNRVSERVALSIPLVLAAGGMVWFSFITAHTNVFAILIPASLVTGIGLGATAVVATSIGVRGIDNSEAGIGSSLLTAGGQVGGALGPGRPGHGGGNSHPPRVDQGQPGSATH